MINTNVYLFSLITTSNPTHIPPDELKLATIHPSTLAQACLLPDELLWQIPSGKRGASRMAISPTSLDGAVNNATWGFIGMLKSSLYGNPYARVFFKIPSQKVFTWESTFERSSYTYIYRFLFINISTNKPASVTEQDICFLCSLVAQLLRAEIGIFLLMDLSGRYNWIHRYGASYQDYGVLVVLESIFGVLDTSSFGKLGLNDQKFVFVCEMLCAKGTHYVSQDVL